MLCPLLLSSTCYLMPTEAFFHLHASKRTPRHPARMPWTGSSPLIDTLPPPLPLSSRVNQRLSPRCLTQLSKKVAALIEVLWQVTSLAVGIRERLGGMPADKRGLLTALNVFSRLKSVFYQGLVKLSSSLLFGDSLVCSGKKKISQLHFLLWFSCNPRLMLI